jgi:hypothetical protein
MDLAALRAEGLVSQRVRAWRAALTARAVGSTRGIRDAR